MNEAIKELTKFGVACREVETDGDDTAIAIFSYGSITRKKIVEVIKKYNLACMFFEESIRESEKLKNSKKMTIHKNIKTFGWQSDHVDFGIPYRSMDVDVGFLNTTTGREDETEFTINSYDEEELTSLYEDFCKENGLPNDTVLYVTIVRLWKKKV